MSHVEHRQPVSFRRHIRPYVMTKVIQLAVFLTLASLVSGCATPYMIDRRNDVADILTATCGVGIGASARLGPLSGGLTEGAELAGLRGGRFLKYDIKREESLDVKIGFLGFEWLAKDELKPRGKNYIATTGMITSGPAGDQRIFYVPFVCLPYKTGKDRHINWAQMTQIDIQAACLFGIRLGFNPGELLDFILGWITIDLFNDDLGRKEENEK